jgi:hypothetical protein
MNRFLIVGPILLALSTPVFAADPDGGPHDWSGLYIGWSKWNNQ